MTTKLTHSQAKFHKGNHGGDRCGTCTSFVRENLCKLVLAPQTADDWCAVGSTKAGKFFSADRPKLLGGIQGLIDRKKGKRSPESS